MRLLTGTHVFLWYISADPNLPVEEADLAHLAGLPPLHRDPFDRIMIAQTLRHGLTIVAVDDAIRAYPVPLLPPSCWRRPSSTWDG